MAPSPTIRRLLKETSELSTLAPNPNPAFHASPVSDSNLHEWHFTLLGAPKPSPYAGGLYHGRITLPSTYPLKPPNFRFLTPSGRFETNRDICLSISGFHEETWMPAWGVRMALTALRIFMEEKGTAGQVGGLESSREVRERLARESRTWRCEMCGKTNEQVMQEWWTNCREKGVNVGQVGDEVALELLPEGMNLETRDPENQPAGGKTKEAASISQSDSKDSQAQNNTPLSPTPPATLTASLSPNISSGVSTAVASPPVVNVSATQQRAHAAPSNSDGSTSAPSDTSLRGMSVPESSAAVRTGASAILPASTSFRRVELATPTRTRPFEVAPAEPTNTADLDRAIGALVAMLILMILKKIFYPATNPSLDDYYPPDG